MSTTTEILNKNVCAACGTARKVNNLRFDPNTFYGYCKYAEICNPEHPNSPMNIIKRGNTIDLVTIQEAEKLYKEELLHQIPDAEGVQQVRKLLEHPISLRINSPDLAKFLVNVKKEYSMDTMADVLRHLLETARESQGVYYQHHKEVFDKAEADKKIEEAVKEVEQPEPTPQPEPQQEVEHVEKEQEDELII